MSQDELVAWLQEHPGWHLANEMIAAGISAYSSVHCACKLLRKNKRVEYKAGGPRNAWLYRAKGDGQGGD
jgi:hypothetical protein